MDMPPSMAGDEEPGDENVIQPTNGQKRPRHESTEQENHEDADEEETDRLRSCITAMQETLATTDDPDIALISDYFKETFEIRRDFVKTHNTTEILTEYPALQLHSCVGFLTIDDV